MTATELTLAIQNIMNMLKKYGALLKGLEERQVFILNSFETISDNLMDAIEKDRVSIQDILNQIGNEMSKTRDIIYSHEVMTTKEN